MSGLNVRRVLGWISIVAVVIAMAGLLGHGRVTLSSHFDQADTTVWYCAGEAINERADPYRVEPLRQITLLRDFKANAAVSDLRLGTHQALPHRFG